MINKITGNKDLLFILLAISLFIVIRSVNFPLHLNFSSDQAAFSSSALEIFQQKKITLIGPTSSVGFEGRQILQGPAIYYFQLIFLLLGNFDPIWSSYFFMLFSAVMIVPLYFGMKMFGGERSAKLISIVYAFFPYFIDYTRFLWNPNFQLSLIPLLVLCLGFFHKFKTIKIFFSIFLVSGFLLQFHYSFILIILGLIFYFFILKRLSAKYIPVALLGFALGFSPLIIFDIRNNFYNIQTYMLLISNWQHLSIYRNANSFEYMHYFLGLSFFIFFLFILIIKNKLSDKMILIVAISLGLFSCFLYFPKPSHGFRMSPDWNYLDELKVHEIIVEEGIQNYNTVNLIYDTQSKVQQYLLEKDNIKCDSCIYGRNEYLYIITDRKEFMNDPAYEIASFKPAIKIKSWDINFRYKLYLYQRIKN